MEKIKVLMIDDNTSLVEMVKEYFSDHKKIAVTLSCKDGEEGLETILNKQNEYDIIFSYHWYRWRHREWCSNVQHNLGIPYPRH